MNKFKFLALSLVCATISFGYNPINAMNNNNVMNALKPLDTDTTVRTPKEIACQILYEILNNGIEKYQNMQHRKEQKILEYTSNVIKFMTQYMKYKYGGIVINETFIDGTNDPYVNDAENMFRQIVKVVDNELKYNNGANENTKTKLINDILKELANFSKYDMLMILR